MREPILEIGEMLFSVGEMDFFFKPSLVNMAKLGESTEIIELYHLLNTPDSQDLKTYCLVHQIEMPSYLRQAKSHKIKLNAAMSILQACCEQDIAILAGEWRACQHQLVYVAGEMPEYFIILLAQQLLEHGIIGKSPFKLKNQADKHYTHEFRAVDYISSAVVHIGLSRQEAEQLTMTEFQLLLKAKYPEQEHKQARYTEEEYDQIMAEYEKSREVNYGN